MTTYIAYACSHFPIQLITMNARSEQMAHRHTVLFFSVIHASLHCMYPPLWVGELIVYTYHPVATLLTI